MKFFFLIAGVTSLAALLTRPTLDGLNNGDLDEELVTAKPTKELGIVTWMRKFSQIQALAKKENKPVFMLFQEVPG